MNRQTLLRNRVVLTAILTFLIFFAFGQECEKLADGAYSFKHKTKGHKKADFKLTIKGDRYTLNNGRDEESRGQIQWWPDNCLFKLLGDNQVSVNLDSLNSVAKLLMKTSESYGGACYEIENKKRFRITYCGNYHITMSEGRIVKRRE